MSKIKNTYRELAPGGRPIKESTINGDGLFIAKAVYEGVKWRSPMFTVGLDFDGGTQALSEKGLREMAAWLIGLADNLRDHG